MYLNDIELFSYNEAIVPVLPIPVVLKTRMKWLDLLVAMQIWPSDQNIHRIYTCIFDLMIKGNLFFAGMFWMRYRNYVLIFIVNLNNSLQAAVFLLELVDMIKEPY